jgi:hypothetical protein
MSAIRIVTKASGARMSSSPLVNVAPNQSLSLARNSKSLAKRESRVGLDRPIKVAPHVA